MSTGKRLSSEGVVALDPRPDHQPGHLGKAAHHLGGNRLFVDRLVERFAHPLVLERVLALDVGFQQLVAALVHAEEDRPQFRRLPDLHVRRLFDPVDVLRRHRVKHVELAREQRRDAGRGVLDPVEIGLVDIDRRLLGAPPVRVLDQHRLHVGLAVLEHERAGAVRVAGGEALLVLGEVGGAGGVVRLAPCLRHDRDRRQVVGQDRVRPVGDEIDGEIVDLLYLLHRRQRAGEVGAGMGRPVEREHHVVGGERGAVMELDPLAQLEPPGGRIGLLPFGGEPGLELHLAVPPQQRLVKALVEQQQKGFLPRIWVHRVGIAVIGPAKGLGLGSPNGTKGGQQRDREQRPDCPISPRLHVLPPS